MAKDSFIIYKGMYEAVRELSDGSLGKLFRAICNFQIDKSEPEKASEIYMAFLFFKNQFRLDEEKYQAVIQRNKENGKNGGRPKNPKNPAGLKKPKKPYNDNDNGTDKENDKDYLEPINFLKGKIEIDLQKLNMNSGLTVEAFELCLTQWSLKVIEKGWEYTGDETKDLKRLRAGFEKWLNSWCENIRKEIVKNKTNGSKFENDRERLTNLGEKFREDFIRISNLEEQQPEVERDKPS